MPRSIVWTSRALGYLWIGLVNFGTERHEHDVQAPGLQIGGYALIGLVMVVWALIDLRTLDDAPARRWLPVALGGIAATAGLVSVTRNSELMVLFACIAVLVAGSDTRLDVALAVAGVGILGLLIGAVVFGGPNAAVVVGFPLTMLGALVMGRHRHTYRMQAEQAAELLAQSKELQVQQRRADVLDERTRIAREIHDVLAHSLGGLGIQIQAARAVLTDSRDVDKALDVLATAQRMASDGLVETRRAVHALRFDTLSLDAELRSLVEVHGSRFRVPAGLAVDGAPRELPSAVTMALLRVAQEALVNAAKHAAHQPIDLRLEYAAHDVRLTIANRLDPERAGNDSELETVGGGYGLTGMRERLLLLGGTLTAGLRGGTWTVVADLPQPPASQPVTTEG